MFWVRIVIHTIHYSHVQEGFGVITDTLVVK